LVLPWASRAVTPTLNEVPAVAVPGAATVNPVTGPGLTVIGPVSPLMESVTVSFAEMVCVPAVFSVALKVPIPAVSAAFAGRVALMSLLVKCTMPE
jgi:hypothetical protein